MAWDKSKPADAVRITTGTSGIRDNFDAIETTIDVDHTTMADPAAATDGEHKKVTLNELASDPTRADDKGFLYTKNVSGATELFYEDAAGSGAAGNVVQITDAGNLDGGSLTPVAWAHVDATGTLIGEHLTVTGGTSATRNFTFSGYTPSDTNYTVNIDTGYHLTTCGVTNKSTAGFRVIDYVIASGAQAGNGVLNVIIMDK